MKRLLPLLALICLGSYPAIAGDALQIEETMPLAAGQVLRIDIPVAELRIEGTKGKEIEVEFLLRCRFGSEDCAEALGEVRLDSHATAKALLLQLEGMPKWHKKWIETEGTLKVPENAPLEVELGVGEIEVTGMLGDLNVELGVGEISARTRAKAVRSVALDVGVGEAELFGTGNRVEGRRSMLIGSEVYWDEGKGDARLYLDVGVGEITVWLE